MVKQFTNVKERGQFERPFHLTQDNFKLGVDWETENEKEIVKIEGQDYNALPWIAPDFRKNRFASSYQKSLCTADVFLTKLFSLL